MRAAIATGVQDIDQYLHVRDDWPKPTLATAVDGKTGKLVKELKQEHLIIKVLACALAPGDWRLFTGKTDMAQLPKPGRPYVIGSDVCGIVTEVGATEDYYKVGDKVIARFDEPQPHGMCAEYACVKTEFTEKCDASIPAVEACTLPASAAAARLIATRYVKQGDRVLILGGSGGLGIFLTQYCKTVQNCGFIATTSTQGELMKALGADHVIDYREQNWWELSDEFDDKPFDIVVDLVNGPFNWPVGACSGTKVLNGKQSKYIQMITGVETEIDMTSLIKICGFVWQLMVVRPLYSKFMPGVPQWIAPQALRLQPGDLKDVLDDVQQHRIKVMLDTAGPFPLTTSGVRDALNLIKSKHAHGKVVVQISKE